MNVYDGNRKPPRFASGTRTDASINVRTSEREKPMKKIATVFALLCAVAVTANAAPATHHHHHKAHAAAKHGHGGKHHHKQPQAKPPAR